MAELEKVIKERLGYLVDFGNEKKLYTVAEIAQDALELLKEQPQIVRCKDCKHWYKDECSHLCGLTGDLRNADWFCADGKRR